MKPDAAENPDPMTLAEACNALWLATLSLMTAYMQTQAPAHRYLMARRIARNFKTLQQQECFTADCRNTFSRLALRWEKTADRLAPRQDRDQGGLGLMRLLR